jgi:hypothetical protein
MSTPSLVRKVIGVCAAAGVTRPPARRARVVSASIAAKNSEAPRVVPRDVLLL